MGMIAGMAVITGTIITDGTIITGHITMLTITTGITTGTPLQDILTGIIVIAAGILPIKDLQTLILQGVLMHRKG